MNPAEPQNITPPVSEATPSPTASTAQTATQERRSLWGTLGDKLGVSVASALPSQQNVEARQSVSPASTQPVEVPRVENVADMPQPVQVPDTTGPTFPQPPVEPTATVNSPQPVGPEAPLVNNPPVETPIGNPEMAQAEKKPANYISTQVFRANPGKYLKTEDGVTHLDRELLEKDIQAFLSDPNNLQQVVEKNPQLALELASEGIDLKLAA